MSFLTYRVPVVRAVVTAPTRVSTARSLSVSARVAAMSEGDVHHENRSAEIEKHKQDSLKKQQAGSAEWKEKLASSSEASVKADRGEVDASPEHIKKLQKEAEKVGQNQ